MNLCFISNARSEHTWRWTRYFGAREHEVSLLTLHPAEHLDYGPVRVCVVPRRRSQGILSQVLDLPGVLSAARRLIRQVQPDVLHAHTVAGYDWLAMLSGFHPYVVTPWGSDVLVEAKGSRWRRLLTTKALRCADLITTDGQHIAEELVRWGVDEDKIKTVYFGTDVDRFAPGRKDRELIDRFSLDGRRLIASTRSLRAIHDVATLVWALPLVLRELQDVALVIIGDGPERRGLEGLAEAIGVSDRIRFVGHVEEQVMIEWLRTVDVYASASLSDAGLSASTAEAMACGLPVVVTDNSDNRRWVIEGVGGFLVPNSAPEALAERLLRLLKDEAMRRHFGAFNRRVIEERNNYAKEMERMEALYESLARRDKEGRQ